MKTKCQPNITTWAGITFFSNNGNDCAVTYLLCNKDTGVVDNQLICKIAPNKKLPASFPALINHVSKNHTHHCQKVNESGIMGCLGQRLEIKCSSVSDYRASSNKSSPINRMTQQLHAKASIDFHELVFNSSLQHAYNSDISELKKEIKKDTWKVEGKHLHPTTAISLTNSSHEDQNDFIPSIGVWYTDQRNPGKSWFLFPFYSIAVECSTTTIIRFDGKTVQHCSCTVKGGSPIFSILKGARVNVIEFNCIITLMDRISRKEMNFEKGDLVYVRLRQKEFQNYGLERQDYNLFDEKFLVYKAEVEKYEKKKVYVKFKYSKLTKGTLQFSLCDVIPCKCLELVNSPLLKSSLTRKRKSSLTRKRKCPSNSIANVSRKVT